MAGERGVAFGRETARRVIRNIREDEARPSDRAGRDTPSMLLPRFFRDFELAEELSGGAGETAEVKWLLFSKADDELVDTGETGEVEDLYGNAWGLEGERGEARFLGGKWIVSSNPGQPDYQGTFASDVTASGAANVSVTIDGNARTVSANVPVSPGTGMKWASGTIVFIAHSRALFRVISITDCPVSTS
jgi:hypothetical protein